MSNFRSVAFSGVGAAILIFSQALFGQNDQPKKVKTSRKLAASFTSYPCSTATPCVTIGPRGRPQGWVVGEVRTFAFGADSSKVINELAALGWVECAGEDAVRNDFNELWRVIGTEWGSPSKFDFYLPDLRGVFLRGWDHGRKAPDGAQFQVEPYVGDLDISHRVNPRPEVSSVSGADPGPTGDHVGSLQPDLVGPHNHGYGYTDYGNTYHLANDDHVAQNILGDGHKNTPGTTAINASNGAPSTETHPSNGYVMYFIYVGKPATIIAPTAAEEAKGATAKIKPKS